MTLARAPLAAQQDTSKASAPPPRVGRILGVFDDQTDMPLNNAEVVDVLSGQAFRTQASGLIGLAGFRAQHDSAVVRVRKLGYADTTFLVMLGPSDTIPLQLFIHRLTTLPRVITEAMEAKSGVGALRDFMANVNDRSLHGRFLTPIDLKKLEALRLGDVLPSLGFGSGRCRDATVFLNGFKTGTLKSGRSNFVEPAWGSNPLANGRRPATPTFVSLDDPLAWYEGIEFYPDFASPMLYGPCSVVLWMRGT